NLTFVIENNGARGTATFTDAATGAFAYLPNFGELGLDSFSFKVSDSHGNVSNIATVNLNIVDPFIVTNTNDSGPGSLRQAMLYANSLANEYGPDVIHFNIPGGGVQTIAPNSQLPNLTEAAVLDGYTQPGSSFNTLANGN